MLNLIVIGLEVEFSDPNKRGPDDPFLWIECAFLTVFIIEFFLRLRLHRFRLVSPDFKIQGTTFDDLDCVVECVEVK